MIPELKGRTTHSKKLGVINQTRHGTRPAVLVETAFIYNSRDAKLLVEKEDDFAKAIAKGIAEYAGLGDIPCAVGASSSGVPLYHQYDFIIEFILRCPHMKDFINAIRPVSQDETNVKNLISITKKWLEQNKDNNYKWKIKIDDGGFDFEFYPVGNKNDCVHANNFNTFEGEQDILIEYSYECSEYSGKQTSGWRRVTFDK